MSVDVTSGSAGHLRVSQRRCPSSELSPRSADLALVFSSYEPRCLEITQCASLKASEAIVFRFTPPGLDNQRSAHAEILRRELTRTIPETRVIELPRSVDIVEVQRILMEVMAEIMNRFGRSISVLIDISTCPKVYFLHLMGMGIVTGMISDIQAFYAETHYDGDLLESSRAESNYRFTEGNWLSVPVPFLEGHFQPGRPRHAVVSMGADAPDVTKLIKRYDPDSLTLISPVPSVSVLMEENARKETEFVRRNFGATEVIEVSALDLLFTLEMACQVVGRRLDVDDISMFCLGSKPQALALALCGVISPTVQIVCRVPSRYLERAHTPCGWSWLYEIKDSSNPAAT
jgi:hypothetical protein